MSTRSPGGGFPRCQEASDYGRRWVQVWTLAATLGVGVAILLWPILMIVVVLILSAGSAVLIQIMAEPGQGFSVEDLSPVVASRSLFVGSAVVATSVFAQLSATLAVGLVTAAAVSSPPAIRWLAKTWHPTRLPQDPEATVRLLAWTATDLSLTRATTSRETMDVVARRQAILDGWEDSDPAGFSAWLPVLASRRVPGASPRDREPH